MVRAPIKDYEIDIYCISTKHAALRTKCKDWLARNQDNVSEWDNMPIRRQLFTFSELYCWSSTKRSSLSFHWKLTCSRHDIEMKNGRVGVRQQSLTHSIWFLYYLPFIQDQSFSAFLYGYPGLFLEIAIIVLLYHDFWYLLDQYRRLPNKYALYKQYIN